MSQFDLTDRVAIITGGGTGIGQGIALEFAKAGADIVLASRKIPNLEKVVGEIKALGRRALAIGTDVRIPEQVDSMVKQTVDAFGKIDILVNNAGASFVCPLEDITPNGWDAVIGVNLKGPYLCCRAAGKVMIGQKSGKIINISSVAGIIGTPGLAHYGAAKAGLINFTKSLAAEWAKYNIYVNCIAPGWIRTEGAYAAADMASEEKITKGIPLGRTGQPAEIGSVAVFLASEASSYLTGETLAVQGGPWIGSQH